MRVVIVGGGLAGPALAAHLERDGVEYTVVEQPSRGSASASRSGDGLEGCVCSTNSASPTPSAQRGARLTRLEVRAGGGTLLREITVPDARFVAIHRADLHAALRPAVPADVLHYVDRGGVGSLPARLARVAPTA